MKAYARTVKFNLFTKAVFANTEDCKVQGRAAGERNHPLDKNPYTPKTYRFDAWAEGHQSAKPQHQAPAPYYRD